MCVLIVAATATTLRAADDGDTDGVAGPAEVFNQRIMPIFRSDDPSSCIQCHLAGVDLKNYILPSHEKTFVSLRDQGLIDLKNPDKSKILTLIQMGEKDLDEGARLIHEKTRRAEQEAFTEWIKACCNDPKLLAMPPLSEAERATPTRPDAVIRHARKSRVVDSFVRNIWSQRMRCFPCHTPHEIDPDNPRHQAAIKTQREFRQNYSDELVKRLDIFRETPEETLQYLIEMSESTPEGELPMINLQDPRKSLIVLKPMSKPPAKGPDGKFLVPGRGQPMKHMGGLKMHPNDQSYKSFIAWMQDYANVVGDRYTDVADLPNDNWFASKLVVRVTQAPEKWPVGTPVQMFVHRWDEHKGTWADEPIAFTQGTVTPRRIVNGALFLLAPKDSPEAAQWDPESAKLDRGKYLIKIYVDLHGRLAKDPTVLLGNDEFTGQAELPRARWREGFRNAELVSGNKLQ